jgi:hypothetical protein
LVKVSADHQSQDPSQQKAGRDTRQIHQPNPFMVERHRPTQKAPSVRQKIVLLVGRNGRSAVKNWFGSYRTHRSDPYALSYLHRADAMM